MNHLLDYPGFIELYETSIKRMYGSSKGKERLTEENRIGSLGRVIDSWDFVNNLICIEGKHLIPMSTCDYLGLSHHPAVKEAAINALNKYGAGATGVRVLTGNIDLYYQLEKEIANLKKVKYAFIGTSGYGINSYLIPHLFDKNYFIVNDFHVHASIYHGIKNSSCSSKIFKHNNCTSLNSILDKLKPGVLPIIMVDGVYSMQGTIAPMREILELKNKYNCKLWVDEAHALGVLGEFGSGLHSYFNFDSTEVNFWVGTFSKSIPGIGGYLASSEINLYELLMGSAPNNIFSSALPPHCIAIAITALKIMREENLSQKLQTNIRFFKSLMIQEGFSTISHPDSSIFLLEIGSITETRNFTDKLRELGVFCHEIIYPALPKDKSSIRLTVTASHTQMQLSVCVKILKETFKHSKISHEN